MDLGLEGRRALVSAASRGLGFAIAERLAREGARVAITSRNPEHLQDARERLFAMGAEALAVPANLEDQASVEEMLAQVQRELGGVDVLVANTGGPPTAPVIDLRPEDWRAAVDQMLIPVVAMVRAMVPDMRRRGWGRVVIMTSSWVKQPRADGGLSAGVRSAVSALAKQLSLELGPDNVLVNQVLPGPCWTDRSRALVDRLAERRGVSPQAIKEEIAQELPLRRYGRPEEVADLVTFLASDRASFITGAAVPVDGGQIFSML